MSMLMMVSTFAYADSSAKNLDKLNDDVNGTIRQVEDAENHRIITHERSAYLQSKAAAVYRKGKTLASKKDLNGRNLDGLEQRLTDLNRRIAEQPHSGFWHHHG